MLRDVVGRHYVERHSAISRLIRLLVGPAAAHGGVSQARCAEGAQRGDVAVAPRPRLPTQRRHEGPRAARNGRAASHVEDGAAGTTKVTWLDYIVVVLL